MDFKRGGRFLPGRSARPIFEFFRICRRAITLKIAKIYENTCLLGARNSVSMIIAQLFSLQRLSKQGNVCNFALMITTSKNIQLNAIQIDMILIFRLKLKKFFRPF